MIEHSPLNNNGDAADSRLAMDRLLDRPISSETFDENTRLVGQRHEEVESDELDESEPPACARATVGSDLG